MHAYLNSVKVGYVCACISLMACVHTGVDMRVRTSFSSVYLFVFLVYIVL